MKQNDNNFIDHGLPYVARLLKLLLQIKEIMLDNRFPQMP
jgi:hypothetical protein